MKRLFIVDPSLKDLRGHHYMLTRAATRSAQAQGFEVIWLCSAQFSGALNCESATVAPVFKATVYDAYIEHLKAHARTPFLKRVMRRLANKKPVPTPIPANFYDDLKAAMAAWSIGENDRMLLHTGDGESLPAVARLIDETPLETLPVFHAATPYDPAGVMPHRRNIETFAEMLGTLKAAGKLENKLFLYAENAYLAEHLSQLWPAPVRPLPIPAMAPPAAGAADLARARLAEQYGLSADSFLVISLGSARLEKGFHHIPDIAEHVFARAGGAEGAKEGIKFVLHASPQIVGRDPEITQAIEALQARPEGEILLLLEPLSDEDYQTLLLASDAVLLPYGEAEYRVRGSAVVTEALAAGKTLVAAANTYPGKMAAAHGGLAGETPADLAEAVLSVYREREAFKARAARESERFIAGNKMEDYWTRCLAAEREAGL